MASLQDDLSAPLSRIYDLDHFHDGGVHVVVLGLQSADMNQLEVMTSEQSITYVQNYDQLNQPTPLKSLYDHLCAYPAVESKLRIGKNNGNVVTRAKLQGIT